MNSPSNSFSFTRETVASGKPISSIVISPDHQHLYAATLSGQILRWDIDPQTGALSNEQTFNGLADQPNGPRAVIGLAFDPTNPDRLWISHNASLIDSSAPNFTGKISYLDLEVGSDFDATVTDYVTGLPRSITDHLSNSIAFGPDGGIYLTQGSNSGMGAPDNVWGNREETLLSAAILRIDPTLSPPEGGFDVQTSGENTYDPFAPDAPVTLFGTGVRNAFDLAWHSNGYLYVPNNGPAAGGNVPDDPSTVVDEGIQNISVQRDYLYRVEAGGYYGHPNPSRGEYILNGGNPTEGSDPAEVVQSFGTRGYPVGVQPEENYQGFVYDFGFNRSPNGVIEYQSDTFDGQLESQLLVVEYAGGDRILGLTVDENGDIIDSATIADGFDNPLDLIEHQPSGRIYVVEFGDETDPSDDKITLLTPSTATDPMTGGGAGSAGPLVGGFDDLLENLLPPVDDIPGLFSEAITSFNPTEGFLGDVSRGIAELTSDDGLLGEVFPTLTTGLVDGLQEGVGRLFGSSFF